MSATRFYVRGPHGSKNRWYVYDCKGGAIGRVGATDNKAADFAREEWADAWCKFANEHLSKGR